MSNWWWWIIIGGLGLVVVSALLGVNLLGGAA